MHFVLCGAVHNTHIQNRKTSTELLQTGSTHHFLKCLPYINQFWVLAQYFQHRSRLTCGLPCIIRTRGHAVRLPGRRFRAHRRKYFFIQLINSHYESHYYRRAAHQDGSKRGLDKFMEDNFINGYYSPPSGLKRQNDSVKRLACLGWGWGGW